MATDIALQKVILSYPHLVTPWAGQQNQEPSFNIALIIPNDFAQWAELQDAVNNASMNQFGANPPPNLKLPWLNRYLQPNTVKDGIHKGLYVINAKSDRKPQLYDQNLTEVPDIQAKSMFFAGCIVNVYVNFYGYNTAGNVGVGTGLRMVQLVDNVNVTRLDDAGKPASEVFQKIPGAPAPTAPPAGPPGVPGAPGNSGPGWQ